MLDSTELQMYNNATYLILVSCFGLYGEGNNINLTVRTDGMKGCQLGSSNE